MNDKHQHPHAADALKQRATNTTTLISRHMIGRLLAEDVI